MDDESHLEPEFLPEASLDEDGSSPEGYVPERRTVGVSEYIRRRYSGAFFPKAKDFVVAGGNFQSVTNITRAAPSIPPGKWGTHTLGRRVTLAE
jgi:hypothetical protein